MYAIMVKPHKRKGLCKNGEIWVKDASHEFYVSKKERGVWDTKAEAEEMVTESCEMVVEVN